MDRVREGFQTVFRCYLVSSPISVLFIGPHKPKGDERRKSKWIQNWGESSL